MVITVGRFVDYTAEIRQSYELGFTPYILHTNVDGTFVTPFVLMMTEYMYWTLLPR